MRISFSLVVMTALCVGAAACDESLSSLTGPTPNLEPTFSSIQSQIFEATDSSGRTACTTCHTSMGRVPTGGMDLNHDAAYNSLVNAPTRSPVGKIRVIPGDPENSYLIHKLKEGGDISGRRMPNNGPPYLTDGQILVIKRWIEIGAPQ